jgi:crescentin
MMLLSRFDRARAAATGKGDRGRPALVAEAPGSAAVEAASGVIGERFETILGSLDQLGELAEQFRAFESLLGDVREPLTEEFTARRDAHIELINLRTSQAEMSERVEAVTAENRTLAAAAAGAEIRIEELKAYGDEHATAVQEARLELDRLRTSLSQSTAQLEALQASERNSSQRIVELEHDQAALRSQLTLVDSARVEADSARALASRDHRLAADENEALKRRMEEVGGEVASLARAAATVEGQLTAERSRAAAESAESARVLRAMENQAESARSEAAATLARLDTATARAARLETLNAEQASRLAELQASSQTAERRGEELQTSLDRALERIRGLEVVVYEARERHAAMDSARHAAVERAESLTKAAAVHEKALARSEERLAKLQAKLNKAQADHEDQITTLNEQVAALRADLEGARADSAMTSAALDTARRERGGRERPEGTGVIQAIAG